MQNLQKLLKQGLETKDIPLLRSILHNSKVAELPAKLLADRWSIKPEDVESPEKVEELYQKLGKQLKGLSNLLEENGQRGSSAYQNVTNLSQNVDFLNRSTRPMPISSCRCIYGRESTRRENCSYIPTRKILPEKTDRSAHCCIWIWNIWDRLMCM